LSDLTPVETPPQPAHATLPLCVDLDGTLVRTDTLVEGMLALAGGLRFATLLGAFAGGRAALKARVAAVAPTDPALLPYNEALLDYLRAQRAAGRRIVLATAANEDVARRVADHLGLFDEVIASSATRNLKGAAKAAALVARFGRGGFAYAGDARADLVVWERAGAAVLVETAAGVAAGVRVPVEWRIATRPKLAPTLLRAMRPHQWVKNLLVFVPILTSHALLDLGSWWGGLQAFVAFSVAASGIYLVNDLLDLSADRAHAAKRRRPFASGAAPLGWGMGLGAALLVLAAVLGWLAGILAVVALYAGAALAYSLALKRQPLVDVFTLAGLFTIRMFGGGEATGHSLSLWLLAFSVFLFLSLALVKRVTELREGTSRGPAKAVAGRSYGPADLDMLQLFGVGAAFAASLVLALYVQHEAATGRFAAPGLLFGIVPLVLLWSCRMWLSTARGYMHHDPILYAARDRVTWAIVLAVVAVMLAARTGLGVR
jgi:4-hydroxybenzoate polyprenyltransferase/phosphoserine phosphatase